MPEIYSFITICLNSCSNFIRAHQVKVECLWHTFWAKLHPAYPVERNPPMTDWNKFSTFPDQRCTYPFHAPTTFLTTRPTVPWRLRNSSNFLPAPFCFQAEGVCQWGNRGWTVKCGLSKKEDKASATSVFCVLYKQCPQLILHDKKINGGSVQ